MGKLLLIVALLATPLASPSATTPQIEVVSKPFTNIAHVFGDSAGTLMSADGRWVTFSSSGNGLATNDNNGLKIDAFLKNMDTGLILLVSRNTNGASANGDSLPSGISSDGRFVLFESNASDLIENDENEATDVFLYDRDSGKISLVSSGAETESGASIITRNGQFILFESASDNLDPKDQNAAADLFLANRETGEIKLVTLNSNNTASASSPFPALNIGLFSASISEDGRYVAYISAGADVVLPKLPATSGAQLFLRDMVGGTNLWISQNATHVGGQNISGPVLSTNGMVLAFLSSSLAAGPQSSQWVHLYSMESNVLSQVPAPDGITGTALTIESFALSGDGKVLVYALGGQIYRYDIGGSLVRITSGQESASDPVVSTDGGIILYLSATNQPPGTTYPSQLFSYNITNKTVALLTPNLSKTSGGNGDMLFPSISADGSTAGFTTYASDLVANDDKHANDVLVVSTSGQNPPVLVSTPLPTNISGTADGSSDVKVGAISSDGNWVAFTSSASDLVPNDDNGAADVFLRELRTGETHLVSLSPDGTHPYKSPSIFLSMSVDGKRVAFSTISNTTSALTRNIFVYDRTTGTNMLASLLPSGAAVAANDGNLSADGKYLAFWPAGSVNETYVRDLETGETKQASNVRPVTFGGISPSGKYVRIFGTLSTLFLVNWQTGQSVQFPRDTISEAPMRRDDSAILIYNAELAPAHGNSLYLYALAQNSSNLVATNVITATISGDGTEIAYLQGGTNNTQQLYTYEVSSGVATPVNSPNPDPGFRVKGGLVLSEDGHYLAFTSGSPLVDPNATNGFSQVFFYDRISKQLTLVSQTADGSAGSFGSSDPSLSADGRIVVFQSSAADLVQNDLNVNSDVFLARIPSPQTNDSDSDGLDDAWELANFGNLSATASDDPDSDGLSNLNEFLAGTDPKNSVSNFVLQPLTISSDGKANLTWSTVAGKKYQLQSSRNLANASWADSGQPQTASGNSLSAEVSVQGSEIGFFRVRVVQ